MGQRLIFSLPLSSFMGNGVLVEPPFKSFKRMAGSAIVISHSVPSHKDKKSDILSFVTD